LQDSFAPDRTTTFAFAITAPNRGAVDAPSNSTVESTPSRDRFNTRLPKSLSSQPNLPPDRNLPSNLQVHAQNPADNLQLHAPFTPCNDQYLIITGGFRRLMLL
jgi:hypothetical protein